MRSIAKYLEAGGSYDQVNLAGLACFEHMARRWQLIMEAHHEDPIKPDYDSAMYYTEEAHEKTGVSPALKAHVAKQMRGDAEVKKQLGKVWELRTVTPKDKQKGKGGDGGAGS